MFSRIRASTRLSVPIIRKAQLRRLVAFLLLTAFVDASSIAGQDSAAPPSRPAAIRGVVINDLTKEPIARALVVSSDNHFATLTDEQGRFAFEVPESLSNTGIITTSFQLASPEGFTQAWPGLLTAAGWLTARKPGFLSSKHQPSMSGKRRVTGNEITLWLQPEAVITGKVNLPDFPNRMRVHLYRRTVLDGRGHWHEAGQVPVRTNGQFRFADLEPGTYKLFTGELDDRDPLPVVPGSQSFGYPPVYFPNASDFQTSSPIQLSVGSVFEAELSPSRQAYYNVKIPVMSGSENDQVMVCVLTQGRRGPGFELGYNERQRRVEGALPNGVFLVEVTKLNPEPAYGSVTIHVNNAPFDGPPITLSPTVSVQVNARLEFHNAETSGPEGTNANAVVVSERYPFRVDLKPLDEFSDREGPRSVTQNDQTVTLQGIMPGRYWVHLDAPRGFVSSLRSEDSDLLRQPLNLGHGSHIVIEATLRDDGGEISGTVEGIKAEGNADPQNQTGSYGSSIPGDGSQGPGYVYCVPVGEGYGQFRREGVMADGTFHLLQVPPGSYRVIAVSGPPIEMEYRSAEAMRAFESKGQLVRVSPGQTQRIELPLTSISE